MRLCARSATRKGEEEARNADRERADNRQLSRIKRIRHRENSDNECEHGGIDGLRDEQVGDALNVGDDSPTFSEDRRNGRELTVQEDDVGNRSACLAAGSHRDPDVRSLQGGNVVDPVPGHGDDMAVRLQSLNDVALLAGSHPAEHTCVFDKLCKI